MQKSEMTLNYLVISNWCRLSKSMVQIFNRRDQSPSPSNQPPIPLIVVAFVCVIFAIAFLALPSSRDDFSPPPGVQVYKSGRYECWDKVVCCDESDETTCSRIPICH